MKDIVTLRAKMYSYFTDDGCVEKRANDVKKCVIKRRIKLQDYKGCLKNNKTMLIFQQRFRCKVYTEKFNKVVSMQIDLGRLYKGKLMRHPKMK